MTSHPPATVPPAQRPALRAYNVGAWVLLAGTAALAFGLWANWLPSWYRMIHAWLTVLNLPLSNLAVGMITARLAIPWMFVPSNEEAYVTRVIKRLWVATNVVFWAAFSLTLITTMPVPVLKHMDIPFTLPPTPATYLEASYYRWLQQVSTLLFFIPTIWLSVKTVAKSWIPGVNRALIAACSWTAVAVLAWAGNVPLLGVDMLEVATMAFAPLVIAAGLSPAFFLMVIPFWCRLRDWWQASHRPVGGSMSDPAVRAAWYARCVDAIRRAKQWKGR